MPPTKTTRGLADVGPFPQTQEIPVPLTVHESVSPLAAELLMKTCDELSARPQNYNQNLSAPRKLAAAMGFTVSMRDRSHGCETACCIYGWMRHFAGLTPVGADLAENDVRGVGLTHAQFKALFDFREWPALFNARAYDHPNLIPASVGIARMEYMLTTGL